MNRRRSWIIHLLVLAALVIFLVNVYVSIGTSHAGPSYRATKVELTLLDTLMRKYQIDHPPVDAARNTDPATTWVQALRKDPAMASQMSSLKTDGTGEQTKVLDPYGTPIEFIPANPERNRPAYFHSAGPDCQMGNADDFFSDGI